MSLETGYSATGSGYLKVMSLKYGEKNIFGAQQAGVRNKDIIGQTCQVPNAIKSSRCPIKKI